MPERLQKYLARCGVASRRRCEELMREGRVTVDGEIVREPGRVVEPGRNTVCYNGREVRPEAPEYWMLNKPPGHVCSSHDPQGRPLAIDLVPGDPGRVYTVGRLDADSEGLIVITNDGTFAHRLSHPRHEVHKKYELVLSRPLDGDELRRWREGIDADGEKLKVLSIDPKETPRQEAVYSVRLGEGKNRHLRRMAEASGIKVLRLKRTAIGPLTLGGLKRGACRPLTAQERASFAEARDGSGQDRQKHPDR